VYPSPTSDATTGPNLIENDDNGLVANTFCFRAFADKNSGILVYHDLTGLFPFMLNDRSVYHYESNSILTTLIVVQDNAIIFNTYKTQFKLLTAKGFKPKLNVLLIKQQNTSTLSFPKTIASCNWLGHTTIVSMQPNT
jgi:hypothetical protein